jgi:hypothetical protein
MPAAMRVPLPGGRIRRGVRRPVRAARARSCQKGFSSKAYAASSAKSLSAPDLRSTGRLPRRRFKRARYDYSVNGYFDFNS